MYSLAYNGRGLRGFGLDAQAVSCPEGWTLEVYGTSAKPEFVCEKCGPATHADGTPICQELPPLIKEPGQVPSLPAAEKPMGIIGWSIVAAIGVWSISLLMKKGRR